MQLDEYQITHLGVATTMDVLDSFYNISSFGDNTVSFVVRRSGGQVYKHENDNPVSKVHNILAAMEQAEFLWGESHEKLMAEIQQGESGCVAIRYNNEPYFLTYAPLSVNEWMSVMMIPEANVGTETRNFMLSVVVTLLVIAALAVALIVTIVVANSHKTNKQLKLAAEAERNANLAKTQFLSSMSHDIRTPMNAIIGITTLAQEHTKEPQYIKKQSEKD